jgi:integrase
MPLTDTALRALKPAARTYTQSDGRGLYVEVLPTGGVIWRFRYRLGGKQEKLTLGKYPDLTLKAARGLRDEAAQKVALGVSPATEKQRSKRQQHEAVTVRDFGERYFREVVAKERKDITLPRRYFDKVIVPAVGHRSVAELAADVDCIRQLIWLKKDQGFDAAAGQVRGLLKRLFDYAVQRGVSPANPVLSLPMRHVHRAQARDRVLSLTEIRTLHVAVAQSNIRHQFKVAVWLFLLTLVRKSELLNARWDHVDFDGATWLIPAENSKTAKPHLVYLSRQALDCFRQLKRLASRSELVLPSRSSLTRPFAHNSINNAVKVAMQGQDVPAFTIHDLRRTASTHLHERGWMPDVIEKALNHEIGGVRGIYNKAQYEPQRREMLQQWADELDRLTRSTESATDQAAT